MPPSKTAAACFHCPRRRCATLKSLLRRDLVTQTPVVDAASTWRIEGDQSIGLIMTAKGASAIGMDAATELGEPIAGVPDEEQAVTSPRPSKQADVVMLMRRADGATIDEIMAATGWLAHSTRTRRDLSEILPRLPAHQQANGNAFGKQAEQIRGTDSRWGVHGSF
jgi:hypothetical protein